MKILYASDSLIPSTTANSVQVMKMCSAFVSAGHQVELLCYLVDEARSEAFSRYGIDPNFDLIPLLKNSLPGVKRILRALCARRAAGDSDKFDLLYGRDLFGTYAACGKFSTVIYEAHVPPNNRHEHWLMARLFEKRSFSRLVCISEALANEYLRLFPQLSRELCIIAHDAAVRLPQHVPEPSIRWPGRSDVIQLGYVGSLLPGKGAEQVGILAQKLPQFDFHVVGGAPAAVEVMRTRYASVENLYLHAHVPHSEVDSYLLKFDIALFPMQDKVIVSNGADIARWTSPMKIFEYMAAERAIISSDLPVLREVLRDGENALLVAATDVPRWCDSIILLASEERLRRRLAHQAHTDFLREYTWPDRVAKVLADLSAVKRHSC